MKASEKLIIKFGKFLGSKKNIIFEYLVKIIQALNYGIKGHEFSYYSDRNGENELIENVIANSDYKDMIIFDCGCNRGDYTNYLLKELNKKNNKYCIYLFDIDNVMIDICKKKFKGDSSIFINNLGLAEKAGFCEAIIYPDDRTRNSLIETPLEIGWNYHLEKVKLTTGDQFCNLNNINRIDLLKLDLEGYDFDALKGFKNLLSKKVIKFLQFEYTFRALDRRILFRDIFEFFQSLEYEVGFIRKDGLISIKTFVPRFNDWTLGPNFYARPNNK